MSPSIVSELAMRNMSRSANRLRFQAGYARWILGEIRWPMLHLSATLLLWVYLDAALQTPSTLIGMPEIMKDGIGLGFALLFWVALTRSYKEHRADINSRDRLQSERIDAIMTRMEAREDRVLRVLEANMTMKGQMIEAAGELKTSVRELLDKRFCPFDGTEHPARKAAK
jgi:hypothetical protein